MGICLGTPNHVHQFEQSIDSLFAAGGLHFHPRHSYDHVDEHYTTTSPPLPCTCSPALLSNPRTPYLFPDSSSSPLLSLYTLHEKLGAGAYASVRRCTSVATGAEYACKSIHKRTLVKSSDWDCVLHEVSNMKMLSGENSQAAAGGVNSIIKLHDIVEDSHRIHLIMELCRGGSLRSRMQKTEMNSNKKKKDQDTRYRVFSEAEAARIMKSLLEALQECHCRGVIHRDVKPANVLFVDESNESVVKLGDFGLSTRSKMRDGGQCQDGKTAKMNRTVAGSPVYMAPEIVRGWLYGEKVDVWSAGVLLYGLLFGRNPYDGVDSDMRSLSIAIVQRPLSFPDTGDCSVSASAKSLLSGLLERNPDSRMFASEALRHPWILRHNRI